MIPIYSLKVNMILSAIPGALLSGLFIQLLLSYMLVPLRVSLPLCAVISTIVFALTRYYGNTKEWQQGTTTNGEDGLALSSTVGYGGNSLKTVLFIFIYLASISVAFSDPGVSKELFISWNTFEPIDLLKLGSAIGLCFFLPGYAILLSLYGENKIGILPKLLFSYTISALMSGLIGYVIPSVGVPISDIGLTLVGLYLFLLVPYIIRNFSSLKGILFCRDNKASYGFKPIYEIVGSFTRKNSSKLLVFAGIFSWVALTSYYLYNGTIIGDQWFHHGRALNFVSGSFRELASAGLDEPYPPFLSALLGYFFTVSGVPSVNAYVSINFLNVVPILAFYYFFKNWVPSNSYKKAALLASVLFMLSSGFGWIEALNMALTDTPPISETSTLEILNAAGKRTFDIRLPNTFINVGNPEGTTGLPILALPAGFLLLGILKEERLRNSIIFYSGMITVISILGILSHDEFYLFIIVACVLPLIFRLDGYNNNNKNSSIYISFLVGFSIIYIVDNILPGEYYTFREIFGIPLLALGFTLVILTWILYVSRALHRAHNLARSLWKSIRIQGPSLHKRLQVKLAVLVILPLIFLYIFAFIVWGQLSLDEMYPQTTLPSEGQVVLPWYLFPMKLGVTGMLAVAFILSYPFKRFEKQLFVFGVIAVIAVIAGPYYDEHRFSKYIAACAAAYASLLVYQGIGLLKNYKSKQLISGVIIGLVITSSSLSVLLYHGYSELGIRNPQFTPFYQTMGTRLFPSYEDLALHTKIHNDLFVNPKTDYFVLPANEYGKHSGLKAQLVGFSGIPNTKIWQSPLTMNSSTLEGFYYLLDRSDSRYIILPKQDSGGGNMTGLTMPVKFALENFEKSYENSKYTVLSVPSIVPPSSKGDISVIYPHNTLLSFVTDKKTLLYNNQTFDEISRSEIARVENSNAILNGDDKKETIWSKDLEDQGFNYIEGRIRIKSGDTDGNERYPASNAGIVWNDDSKEYYLSLDNQSLKLEQKSISKSLPSSKITATYNFEDESLYDWHSFRIISLNKSIYVYVDGIPVLEIPRIPHNNNFISHVGIRSLKSLIEFEPIKVGRVNESARDEYQKREYYEHYYPINVLSLSNVGYDTFVYGDSSAFSNRNAILTWDPLQANISNYLNFVKSGGTLVVTHIGGKYSGMFSKELSVRPSDKVEFTSIQSTKGMPLNVSGVATNIKSDLQDAEVKSFYTNGNAQPVAPFAIEKNYEGGGRIIFVNMEGYYNAITRNPHIFFKTLGYITEMIGVEPDSYSEVEVHDTKPVARIVGNLRSNGNVSTTGSSLLFSENQSEPNSFSTKLVSISDQKTNHIEDNKTGNQKGFKNAHIKDLKLSGQYEAEIYSNSIALPTMSSALYGYEPMTIPSGSNIRIKLGSEGRAEFSVNGSDQTIKVDNGEVAFQQVAPDSQNKSRIFILMKSPHIRVNGSAQFANIVSENLTTFSRNPVQINGSLMLDINHLDKHYENARREIRTNYVTFLNDIDAQNYNSHTEGKLNIKIPGDISQSAKEQGIEVPWEQALLSNAGVLLILGVAIVGAVTLRFVRKEKLKAQRDFI